MKRILLLFTVIFNLSFATTLEDIVSQYNQWIEDSPSFSSYEIKRSDITITDNKNHKNYQYKFNDDLFFTAIEKDKINSLIAIMTPSKDELLTALNISAASVLLESFIQDVDKSDNIPPDLMQLINSALKSKGRSFSFNYKDKGRDLVYSAVYNSGLIFLAVEEAVKIE